MANSRLSYTLELEQWFATHTIPDGIIPLTEAVVIVDAAKFIAAHLATCKRHHANRRFLPYLYRLHQLKTILEEMS